MTREQKQLLYEIAQWHSKDFSNEMNDHWTEQNFACSRECAANINRLEKEYKETYGELPKWEYIDDVWNAMKQLEEELR